MTFSAKDLSLQSLAALIAILSFTLMERGVGTPAYAQAPGPPITPSGLGTVVTTNGNIHAITGGTRPGGGANLFHSFGEFGVPANSIANFLNENPQIATSNILGRVTNGNPSSIFGTIQTEGFGNANLFLMNPAGFLFGPNATLNVGGVAIFTTANYTKLADDVRFNAMPGPAPELLSAAPVVAFGFLGSNPGAITIQGSRLDVADNQGISLVGGDITIGSGLSAPGGQINLASVASAGEVSALTFQPTAGMTGGTITLFQSAKLDVSADAAGTVRIRGGQLVMDNAIISADTGESNGAPIAVDIDVTGEHSISSTQTSAITARATGAGDAGEIRLNSAKLDMEFAYAEFGVVVDSSTVGSGKAGKVTVTTGDLTAANSSTGFGMFIDSGTGGGGNGGDVTIKVRNGDFLGAGINTGDAILFGTGSAGNLYIGGTNSKADSLLFDATPISTEAFSAKAGSIMFEASDILIKNNTFVSSISLLGENPITIEADRLAMDNVVRVQAQIPVGGVGNGGDIVFRGSSLEMTNESVFLTQTFGSGNSGAIRVFASDRVLIADNPLVPTPSGLFTDSIGDQALGTGGAAGPIEVNTLRLDMLGGGRFNTTTRTGGAGGNVTVTASEGIFISGQRMGGPLDNFGLGVSDGSGIYTRSIGTEFCGGPCGKAGDQIINARSLVLNSGGTLDSGTTGTGAGGTIRVNATNEILISGTLVDGTPGGVFSRTIGQAPDAGRGGDLNATAGQSIAINNGASVSASSTGPGDAGNISINAGQRFEMRDSSVKTEAAQASGGNIDIQAVDRVRLVNSTISSSVQGGSSTAGGNITIDPNSVILQNSQILAQAVQGNGGNISIFTPFFLADASSVVDASSQFGLSGTVTIQNPTSNLSGTLGTLSSKPKQAQTWLTQRCAALANGQASSFVVAGREQLPPDPGSWLTSPLVFAGLDADPIKDGIVAEGTSNLAPRTSSLLANDIVSLRRLTPAGFLTANFAVDQSAGCGS